MSTKKVCIPCWSNEMPRMQEIFDYHTLISDQIVRVSPYYLTNNLDATNAVKNLNFNKSHAVMLQLPTKAGLNYMPHLLKTGPCFRCLMKSKTIDN